jgi:hypothetical protein
MTTAKRRSVRWLASESNVSRKCCGRRKVGTQTTIPTEGSSEGDAATTARQAGAGGGSNSDTPDSAVGPETPDVLVIAVPTGKSHRESASIDMHAPDFTLESKRYNAAPVQYVVQRCALPRRFFATVNAAELTEINSHGA